MTRHSILVVDDSPTDRHFLSELLLSQGYHVTAVDNGEAALAAIKSNPPHLVIMDVVMPGQNGFQATREITRDPATRSLPVIICTSKNQETDRIWGKAKISGIRILEVFSRIFQNLTLRTSPLSPAWSLARIKRLLLILLPIVFLSFVLFSWLNARYTSMAVSRTL